LRFAARRIRSSGEYNYRRIERPMSDIHGLSAFALDETAVYHTCSCYARGTDPLSNAAQLLDRAPKGRGG
jgi:predicted dithiol-disulfide oxidoreductase (DUF899 family)